MGFETIHVIGILKADDERLYAIDRRVHIHCVNVSVATRELIGTAKGKPRATWITRVTHAIEEEIQGLTCAVSYSGERIVDQEPRPLRPAERAGVSCSDVLKNATGAA